MYSIILHKNTKKQIKKIDSRYHSLLKAEIAHVAEDPFKNSDLVKDNTIKGSRKSRKGDYRILYDVDKESKTLIVQAILNRDKAYKKS